MYLRTGAGGQWGPQNYFLESFASQLNIHSSSSLATRQKKNAIICFGDVVLQFLTKCVKQRDPITCTLIYHLLAVFTNSPLDNMIYRYFVGYVASVAFLQVGISC